MTNVVDLAEHRPAHRVTVHFDFQGEGFYIVIQGTDVTDAKNRARLAKTMRMAARQLENPSVEVVEK
jgi:hypothetical protein